MSRTIKPTKWNSHSNVKFSKKKLRSECNRSIRHKVKQFIRDSEFDLLGMEKDVRAQFHWAIWDY